MNQPKYERLGLTSLYQKRESLIINGRYKLCTPFQVATAQLYEELNYDPRYNSTYTELLMVSTSKPTKFMQLNIASCENKLIAIVQESLLVKSNKMNQYGNLVIFPEWNEYIKETLTLDLEYHFNVRDLDPCRDI